MSFVNSIFLAGIAAAAIPIALHFVRKMQAREVKFGTLMFLSATPKEMVKKRRLRDVLLMAMRASLFVVLAIVFARPFLESNELQFLTREGNTSTVILLDQSYSMMTDGVHETAIDRAREVISAGAPGDEVSVIVFSDAPRRLTSFDMDREAQLNLVASIDSPTQRTTEFYEALRLADEVLADARHENQRVVLISDMQLSGWSDALENWNLPPGVSFEPSPVGRDGFVNGYIEDVAVLQRRISGSENGHVAISLDARVQSGANLETDVQLSVNGDRVEEQSVEGGGRRVTFQHSIEAPGFYQGSLRSTPDALTIDDTYHFTIRVDRKPSVLSIDNSTRGRFNASFFLGTAFDLGDDGPFEYSSGNRNRIARNVLDQHTVVFLSDVGSLSQRETRILADWVADGGYLLASPGEATDPADFSRILAALQVGSSDAIITSRRQIGTEAIVGDVEWRHPVFSAFADGGGVILRPRFRKYMRIQPDSASTVIGSYDTGDPFLVERRQGAGSVLIYTSSINNAWTDFPINEMYIPFVYQIAGYAAQSASRQLMYEVGDVVAFDGDPGDRWEIRAPDGRVNRVEVPADVTVNKAFFRETDVAGHYTAARGSERFLFSVNADRSESDITARDESEVYAAVISPHAETQASVQSAALSIENDEDQKLWRLFLAAVILLMVVETIAAHRGSREKRPATAASSQGGSTNR